MIAHYNNLSLALGVPGLILQIAGGAARVNPSTETAGTALVVFGALCLVAGLSMYAVAKGRSPAWGVLGFFSLLGLIGLGLLEDRAPKGKVKKR